MQLGGIDGDRPMWTFKRLPAARDANTKMEIFEPDPTDPDKKSAVEYAERTPAFLRERNMPTIYVSSSKMQTKSDAAATVRAAV